jgi:serine protease Do
VYNGLVERSFLPQLFFGGSLNAGMSGGPAVDDAGRVIGVNVAARRDGTQVSFLVPAQFARELLERGRGAQPLARPMYDEVTRQLKAHQAALVDAFVAQPWRSANHPRYRVPVPQETFVRCWGSTSPETRKYLRFERSDCVMNHPVYASPQLRAGMINVRHESYDGDRLGALRFAREYSASFANERFAGGFAVTAPRCKEGFTERDGLTLRTVACLSALKRFEGLFNLSVLTTTVDHPTQGVQGRLDAVAVDFANALRLTEHYLQGFGWNDKAEPK